MQAQMGNPAAAAAAASPAAVPAAPADPTLVKANKNKDKGNSLFKEGKFRDSIGCYEQVRQMLQGLCELLSDLFASMMR